MHQSLNSSKLTTNDSHNDLSLIKTIANYLHKNLSYQQTKVRFLELGFFEIGKSTTNNLHENLKLS